ncbi:hypothetical protein ACFYYY_14960 [Streptomyces sp. NPDC001834]|uniref:hypothetical protein n=1 Tax=Streptomyces sp. NPDC001834 TaxID=3364616 RepID=UPI003673DF5A
MSDETRSDTYAELAALGPYGVRPGHALITLVEPAVAETGIGRVELVAPFIPTVPGTDAYVDQLR